ncbi:hypothetical protein OSB04_017210 [Centaurea solstitialis]|uniref:Uncharacterized protein n=1 Tax=Centaurea solstitialis TaxID=347529 RepID=A0AA38TED3_9ASTR|nr:hypothetical protein OSB04_017210 [Centaurea solstitialis]
MQKRSGLKNEKRAMMALQGVFRNRWAKIAKFLPRRMDDHVKNFFTCQQKRLARDIQMRPALPPPPPPSAPTPKSHHKCLSAPPLVYKTTTFQAPIINSERSEQILDYSGTEDLTLNSEDDQDDVVESWMDLQGGEGFEGESKGPEGKQAEGEEARQDEEVIETIQEAVEEEAHPRQPDTEPSQTRVYPPQRHPILSQPAHLHTLATHSTTSKLVVVSSSHGELPQIPPFTHLKMIGVEFKRDTAPTLAIIECTSSPRAIFIDV